MLLFNLTNEHHFSFVYSCPVGIKKIYLFLKTIISLLCNSTDLNHSSIVLEHLSKPLYKFVTFEFKTCSSQKPRREAYEPDWLRAWKTYSNWFYQLLLLLRFIFKEVFLSDVALVAAVELLLQMVDLLWDQLASSFVFNRHVPQVGFTRTASPVAWPRPGTGSVLCWCGWGCN